MAAKSLGARRPKVIEANPEVPSTRSVAGATVSQPSPLGVVVGQMFLRAADVAHVKGVADAAVDAASGPADTVVGVVDPNVSLSAHMTEYVQTTPSVHVIIVGLVGSSVKAERIGGGTQPPFRGQPLLTRAEAGLGAIKLEANPEVPSTNPATGVAVQRAQILGAVVGHGTSRIIGQGREDRRGHTTVPRSAANQGRQEPRSSAPKNSRPTRSPLYKSRCWGSCTRSPLLGAIVGQMLPRVAGV